MTRLLRMAITSTIALSLLASACGGSGGPRKVVVNQRVCGNVKFLRMNLGETNRVILDNREHSDDQAGMSMSLTKFPVVVKGPVPEGSKIDSPFSTIKLHAAPGEQTSVDLEPTFSGTYNGTCNVTLTKANGAGQQVIQKGLSFELK